MTSTTTDQAPDFERPGYPSKGKRIGPLWQQLWEATNGGAWWDRDLLAETAHAHGCAPKTALNLLHKAYRAGHLERRVTDQHRLEYRRPR